MGCSVCGAITKKGKEVAETKVVEELEKIQEQATATPAAAEAKPTATKAAGETEPEATKPPAEGDSGTTFTGDEIISWESLESYRYELSMQGTQEGDEMTMNGGGAFVKDPPAAKVDLEITSAQNGSQVLRFIRLSDKVYLYDQEREGWMAMGADNPMMGSINVVDLMMDEMMAQFDKTAFKLVDAHAKMNGVDCSHYRVAAKELEADFFDGEGEITSGNVDLWIANELGVLIRYEMDVEGKDGEGRPAKAQMTIDVLDVNQPVEISPPPESEILGEMPGLPGLPTSVPQEGEGIAKTLPKPESIAELEGVELATAQAMAESGDADVYKISMSIEDATAFYESAFADAGWSKQVSPPVGEGLAVLIFGKDGKTATVMVNGMFSETEPMVIVFVQ
jgi:hypothetical protein